LAHVLCDRVLTPDNAPFWLDQGMPPFFIVCTGNANMLVALPSTTWLLTTFKSAYTGYLLNNVPFVISDVFNNVPTIIGRNVRSGLYYYSGLTQIPLWQALLDRTIYLKSYGVIFACLGITLLLGLLRNRRLALKMFASVVLFWLFLLPNMVLVWAGDTWELERHSFCIRVLVRLLCYIMLLWAARELLPFGGPVAPNSVVMYE
jgi:hypothetical protein